MADAYVYFLGMPATWPEAFRSVGRLGSLDQFYIPFEPSRMPSLSASVVTHEPASDAVSWSFGIDDLYTDDTLVNVENALAVINVTRSIIDTVGVGIAIANGGLDADEPRDSERALASAAFAYPVACAHASTQLFFDRTLIAIDLWRRIGPFNDHAARSANAVDRTLLRSLERGLSVERARLAEISARADSIMKAFNKERNDE